MGHGRLKHKQGNPEKPKMFQFIRELNVIYADENEEDDSKNGQLNLDDMPVYKSFEFIDNYTQELKGSKANEGTNLRHNRQNEDGVVRNQGAADDSIHRAEDPTRPTIELQENKGRRKIYVKRDEEDFDMPEMVAFFEEGDYQFFKDIFMDGQSASQDDSLVEDYGLDRYNLPSILNSEDTESVDSTKETLERLSCITNELQLEEEYDSRNDHGSSKRFLMEDDKDLEDEIDEVLVGHSAEAIRLFKHGRLKMSALEDRQDSDRTEAVRTDSPGERFLYASHKRLAMEKEEYFDERHNIWTDNPAKKISPNIRQIKEIARKEATLPNSLSPSTIAVQNHHHTTSKRCLQSDGESSSIAVDDYHSSPISFRSSTSTASACSFAFPILVSEWPGSPTRMAVPENKRWSPMPIPDRTMPIADRRKPTRKSRWRVLICWK